MHRKNAHLCAVHCTAHRATKLEESFETAWVYVGAANEPRGRRKRVRLANSRYQDRKSVLAVN